MKDTPRLIEVAFPLKQTSLDSVHEKNVRHGHISTLHIWPARRPLAACRAALAATLLPDPGNDAERKEILEKLAGRLVETVDKKTGKKKYETEGGILHWGRESGPDLDWFRKKIKEAYGGRAPKVLDPFAGGGAIPLEAMRLGCEATAIDINPVAWFILKCTLEYPQKLAGQKRPLPDFVAKDPEFMAAFIKAQTGKSYVKKNFNDKMKLYQYELFEPPEADLAWHVRAWGWWVLNQARKELAEFYPTYADYQPLKSGNMHYEEREPKLVPLDEDGNADIHQLNIDYDENYLKNPHNPRWVAKPTVAYLWARTVKCKNCRATIPLLKTRWLCKKDKKRVLLTMEPNADKTGVVFGIEYDVPVKGGNAAQKREHDKKVGAGTMSRTGVQCPCCPSIMTMEDLRTEGKAGRLAVLMTAVVVVGPQGKEYRLPHFKEITTTETAHSRLDELYTSVPFGLPSEPLPSKKALGFRVPLYGFDQWNKLFTNKQLLTLGTFVKGTREVPTAMTENGYPNEWTEAVSAELAVTLDKLADRQSTICRWDIGYSKVNNTFTRYALPIVWDFCEANPLSETTGNYQSCSEWVAQVIEHVSSATETTPAPHVIRRSATKSDEDELYDIIVTDPPYYDAIPYSDLMDFFYIWLRRINLNDRFDWKGAFESKLGPKWDDQSKDGELIDDSSRHAGNKKASKDAYEEGMFQAFKSCHARLRPEGRVVIVFAHKHPDAWETLVAAIIRAGFVVDGSWPIQTEMGNRQRALTSGALSSSIWLVCKKRPATARPGWDNNVLEAMKVRITECLRDFWDAGIRGPDFVWAATGPAMEAYSKHPVVKKANKPGEVMAVPEFLQHVRRMVLNFVVHRILTAHGDMEVGSQLDDVTTYYLLHRHDFGLDEAPSGACIMYAVSCSLSDKALQDQWDILMSKKSRKAQADIENEGNDSGTGDDGGTSSGGKMKLVPWTQRKKKSLGYQAPSGRPIPLIDQVHRLMHLWKSGDQVKVDEYIDQRAIRNNKLFHQLLQALIELADPGKDERQILESLSNHVAGRGEKHDDRQSKLEGVE